MQKKKSAVHSNVCVSAPLTRAQILQAFGDFSLNSPGVFAKQFGICLSATTATIPLRAGEIVLAPDITSGWVDAAWQAAEYSLKKGQTFCFTGNDILPAQ